MKTGSQIFNFKRYADCVKRDLALSSRAWLLRAALIVAVMTIILVFVSMPNYYSLTQPASYYIDKQLEVCFNALRFCLFIFAGLGASLFMENMTSNGKRLNELMSPASTLEKYLSRWTICVLGVTIAFFVCFVVASLLRVWIIDWIWEDVPGLGYYGPFELLGQAEKWYMPWCALISIQATFVLGSTVWPKNSFLKTFGTMFALQLSLILCVFATQSLCLGDGMYTLSKPLRLTQDDIFTIISIGSIIWTLFCYIVAYFRMRESEIINRF